MNPKLWLAGKAMTVGGHVIGEKITRPTAETADDVPISGATITEDWLTAVLCRDVPRAEVVSFENPDGSSGTSERVALRVTYNEAGREAGLPTDLFTKATASYRQRMVIGGAGVLEGENHFFTVIRPKSTIEAPLGYWGAFDPASWRSIMVMEDVTATKGATFPVATTPLSHEQVQDLVQNLARLHGELWGNTEALAPLKTPHDYISRTIEFLDIRKRCEVGMERAKDEIPASLYGQSDRIFDATVKAMDIATDEMPRTLLHGDSHVGQTYITSDGRMGLADWHGTMQGGWAFDFAYLVNSACEPDDRRRWQEGLMQLYLERLAQHGGEAPSFDDAWLAYRQQCFWPYTAWAFTIGRAFYQPEMQPVPTCLAIVRRTAAAIDDLDALEAIESAGRPAKATVSP